MDCCIQLVHVAAIDHRPSFCFRDKSLQHSSNTACTYQSSLMPTNRAHIYLNKPSGEQGVAGVGTGLLIGSKKL